MREDPYDLDPTVLEVQLQVDRKNLLHSIDYYAPLMRSGPMAELLTYWVESHHPKTHHNLFTGNNQLGRQKGRTCLQKDWTTCTLHTEQRPPLQRTNQCRTKENGIWFKRRKRQWERKLNHPHWWKEVKHSWILQPNPKDKRHREKAPDRSYENEKENPKQEHRKTRKTMTKNLETIGLWP